ncbi:hypothetical protein cypCar_00005059 [Cyprinus carpio]|nr:hypothetical protein cypCar_00005059 [Cyprinus carpio]
MRVSWDAAALTKGFSEYRSKYKGRTTRSRSDSPHRRMRLAGLRSDQSRTTREPQFISKRKVPLYPPQISSSFRWEGHDPSPQRQEKGRPVTPPAVTPVLRAHSAERVVTPLAPRDPVPPEGTAAPSQQLQTEAQAAQTSTTAADQQQPRLNGINHVLRKRAGLRSEQQRNGRLSSEYQRQFMWKTPAADSPLLAAHEMLYSNNRAIPPFKSNPVTMESEYKRSFKGSPPPRPPRLRRDVEQHEVPQLDAENTTPEKSKGKKKKKKKKQQQQSRKSSPEEEVTHRQQQEVRSPCALRDPSLKVMRKGKTEYRSNFGSPLQYSYRDGAWVKIKTANEEAESGSLPHSSPAAGLTTVDPLPMQEDAWSEEEAADYSTKPSEKQQTSHRHKAALPPPATRIQGTMRNPEFQHNGNLGIFRPELFVFPEAESSCVSDNDDKMSQISSRSAASCSMASELLGRVQRRKEEFWGKS